MPDMSWKCGTSCFCDIGGNQAAFKVDASEILLTS